MRLGFGEILIVLVIALLVFGPTKLPQLGEALGKGIRNFKKATTEDDEAPPPRAAQGQLPESGEAAPRAPAASSKERV